VRTLSALALSLALTLGATPANAASTDGLRADERTARAAVNVPAKIKWHGLYKTFPKRTCFEARNKTGKTVRVRGDKVPPNWFLQYCTDGMVNADRYRAYTRRVNL
jgi:hypothetical protein